MNDYQCCTRCVMDTSDPDIQFDEQGICNHCHNYDRDISNRVFSGKEDKAKLEQLVARIHRAGTGKAYDAVIGVSGGVDSTFVAYKVKQLGLRPVAVHVDNGWDSELAVKNIEQTLKRLGIDLYTEVLDWEEFRDLQLSFLKASTPDSEIPTDHAIAATMRHMAHKLGIKYILSGVNLHTESHLPRAWSRGHADWKYIDSVQKIFGHVPLKSFPHLDYWTGVRYQLTQAWVDILNYLDYVKKEALPILEREIGWKYYGGKHYESIYTRFYQGYILPRKFGYDKRRAHLSSLVCSGEMTRQAALDELQKPTYAATQQEEDHEYVLKKLGLTDNQFEKIMNLPKKSFWDYPSYASSYQSRIDESLRTLYKGLKRKTRRD